MKSLKSRKYKDELPLNTINKIRNILNDVGIFTIEENWKNSAEGFCSVRVNIQNTNLGTNGKGTSYEYALASAYAELMERLQNQAFFRLGTNLSDKAFEYKGFYYAPDEKQMSINDFINSNDEWTINQLSKLGVDTNKRKLLEKWIEVSYEDTPSDFISLPYMNLNSNKLSYIPIKMISKIYMSNGMCAGNSNEEALVQGISEVIERHVNKEIIRKKITPPSIPRAYIRNFPRLDSMISQIESSGNFEVIVKDCSLNEGFPVIGVIFIDKDTQSYFIKFGSHPMFEIALERTLTELLQGQDVKKMMGLKEYSYKTKIDNEYENLIGILVDGSGYYPFELFGTEFDYEFKEFENNTELSNEEMLNYLINLLKTKSYDIFIRDVSYLGFSSFHVIVPGLSEVDEFDDISSIDSYSKFNQVKKHIRNLNNLSDDEIDYLTELINDMGYNTGASITQVLNIHTEKPFPWYYSSIGLFLTAIHYKKGDFKKAYEYFNEYLKHTEQNSYSKGMLPYYRCVRDYMAAKIDNLSDMDIITTLKPFYPFSIIQGAINEFKYPEKIFNYGEITCWDCENCKVKSLCSHKSIENVYKVLKDSYAKNNINQENIILNI